MDAIILILLIIVIGFWFRKLESVVYLIAIIDIFLRILTTIKNNISSTEIYTFLNNYIPSSVPNIIDRHTSGLFNEVILWIYLFVMIIFEYYLIKYFIKKRK